MGLLNLLFRRPKSQPAQPPIANDIIELGDEISKAWGECGLTLRPYIIAADDLERNNNYLFVLQEFFYFFVHVADRHAVTVLGQAGRDKLMKDLIPYTIHVIAKVIGYGFAPAVEEKIKQDITAGLEEKRNYYVYGELYQPNPEDEADTFWVYEPLIIGVTLHSGRTSPEPQFTKAIISTTEDKLRALDLENRLVALKHVLS